MTGVESSLAAMQQSITQLTQAIGQTLTPQGKGQGKGSAKGQGKGNAKPPGARKAENLKPHSERASPTVEEVSCIKCKAYNWTSRCVCRSCGTALPQGNKAVTPPPSSGPATVKSGGASSSVASSGLSYAAVAKGAPGQAEPKTDEKAVKTQKADKLEALLATLDPKDPLREDLQPQLDQLRNDLRDPRQPGARLDSAVAKKRKAEAKVAKCEEALRQAEESLRVAKEENTAADSELKAAREAASPTPPPPAHPQGAAGLTLSSDDMAGLTNMLQQCGLLAVAVQGTEEEEGGGETTQGRPICKCQQNSPGDRYIGRPCPHQQTCTKCHLPAKRSSPDRCRAEWGWIISPRDSACFTLRGRSPSRLPKREGTGPGPRQNRRHGAGHTFPGNGSGLRNGLGRCVRSSPGASAVAFLFLLVLAGCFGLAQGHARLALLAHSVPCAPRVPFLALDACCADCMQQAFAQQPSEGPDPPRVDSYSMSLSKDIAYGEANSGQAPITFLPCACYPQIA